MNMTRSKARWLELLLTTCLSLGLSAHLAAQPAPPRVQPDSGPWDSGAGFHFELKKKKLQKTRQSVSGIACTLNVAQQRVCLLAFDEGAEARYAILDRQSLRIALPPVVPRGTSD